MNILAISGRLRRASTNMALLMALAAQASPPLQITVFAGWAQLPPFNPDHEGPLTSDAVLDFARTVARVEGIIIACPEYVHALPGAFKNAIDWLVSGQEIIHKPIALLHASRRGADVLADLRRVLGTVSNRFAADIFAQFNLTSLSPHAVAEVLTAPDHAYTQSRASPVNAPKPAP